MPIEFHCIKCGSLLRVPDEIYGHKTQCPNCEEIQTVYAKPTTVAHAPVKYEVPAFYDTGNPYQAPAGDYRDDERKAFNPSELVHTQISLVKLIQDTVDIFIGRIVDFIYIALINIGVNMFLFAALQISIMAIWIVRKNDTLSATTATWLTIIVSILAYSVGFIMFAAGTRYALHIARGGESNLGLLFKRPGQLVYSIIPSFLVLSLLVVMLAVPISVAVVSNGQMNGFGVNNYHVALFFVTVGCVCMFILALVASRLLWYICFFMDRDEGPLRCIHSSIRYSSSNVMVLTAFFFIWQILTVTIGSCLCGIGGIFTAPLINCGIAIAYLSMTGQPYFNPKSTYNPGSSQEFDQW